MINIRILVPEATTNYIKNPSFRYATEGWTVQGATMTRTLEQARFNIASAKVVTAGSASNEGIYYRVSELDDLGGGPVTVSAYVRGTGKVRIRLYEGNLGAYQETYSQPVVLSPDRWKRIEVSGNINGTNDVRLYVETDETTPISRTFYVDGGQMETKHYSTSYCDGDQDGCQWNIAVCASNSTRTGDTRAGGRWVPIAGPCTNNPDLYVTTLTGFGVPPLSNSIQPWAQEAGSFYQSTKVGNRVVILNFHAKNAAQEGEVTNHSLAQLHKLRQQLIDIVSPYKTIGNEAFLLEYSETDADRALYCRFRYEAGLEGDWDVRNGYVNSFPLRLLGVDPYWVEDSQDVIETQISPVFINLNSYTYSGVSAITLPSEDTVVIPNASAGMLGLYEITYHKETKNIYVLPRPSVLSTSGLYKISNSIDVLDNGLPDGIEPTTTAEIVGKFSKNVISGYPLVNLPSGEILFTPFVFQLPVTIVGNKNSITVPDTAPYPYVVYNPATDTWRTFTVVGNERRASLFSLNSTMYVLDDVSLSSLGDSVVSRVDFVTGQTTGVLSWNESTSISFLSLKDGVQTIGNEEIIFLYYISTYNVKMVKANVIENSYVVFPDVYDTSPGGEFHLRTDDNGNIYFYMGNTLTLYHIDSNTGIRTTIGNGNTPIASMTKSETGGVIISGTFDDFLSSRSVGVTKLVWPIAFQLNIEMVSISSKVFETDNNKKIIMIGDSSDLVYVSATTTIDNKSTSPCYPVLHIKGQAYLKYMENISTGKKIYLDLFVYENENVTIDFGRGIIESSTRGSLMQYVLSGSEFRGMSLVPGENKITILSSDTVNSAVSMLYTPTHYSTDAVKNAEAL